MFCDCEEMDHRTCSMTGGDQEVPETECYHKYTELLKKTKYQTTKRWTISSSPPKRNNFRPLCTNMRPSFQNDTDKPFTYALSHTELTACLQIGAEAEKRQEVKIEELLTQLQEVIRMNDTLMLDMRRKEDELHLLKEDIRRQQEKNISLVGNIKQLQVQNKHFDNELASLENENQELKGMNEKLKEDADKLRSELNNLKNNHSSCLSPKETNNLKEEIQLLKNHLNQVIEKHARTQQKMAAIKEKNVTLSEEVFNLHKQLEQELQKQCDMGSSYSLQIHELNDQVDILEQELQKVKEELDNKLKLEFQLTQKIDSLKREACAAQNEKYSNLAVIEHLSETVKNQDIEIRNLIYAHTCETAQMEERVEQLITFVAHQNGDCDSFSVHCNQRCIVTTDQLGSKELFNEVCAVQKDICEIRNSIDESGIIDRIKFLGNQIIARMKIEKAKRDGMIEKLNKYKCEFAKTQAEIAELRANGKENVCEEIQRRVSKERMLSFSICEAEKERRNACAQYDTLIEALTKLKKICSGSRKRNKSSMCQLKQ